MMSERPNPIDAPARPSASCPECGYHCDYARAVELESVCPECGEWLESNDDDYPPRLVVLKIQAPPPELDAAVYGAVFRGKRIRRVRYLVAGAFVHRAGVCFVVVGVE